MDEPILRPPRQPERCELCDRALPLTRHHLIPRTLHGKQRIRRRFSHAELHCRLLWVCRPCHSKIHSELSEKELAERFHSRDQLKAHPEIARFIDWIAAKPAGFKPKARPRRRR